MLGMPQRRPDFRLAVGHAVAVGVAQPHDRVVAGANEIGSVEDHAVGAAGRHVGKLRRPIGPAVAVVVVQNLDVSGSGHDDPAPGVDGHRKDVVGQRIVGVERNFETRRHAQAEILRRGGCGQQEHEGQLRERQQNARQGHRTRSRRGAAGGTDQNVHAISPAGR